jgi:hypothetical protein
VADALPFGKAAMRETTASVFRSSPAAGTVLGLVLAASVVAAPTFAAPDVGSGCPPNLDCNARIAKLLNKGAAQSERLRALVDFLGRHPDVELGLQFRRQKPGKHAQSFLTARGIYVRDGEETKKRITGVTGEVVIPLMAYGHEQIARLAHELQHVRVLLEGSIPMGSSETEQAVIEFEQLVRAELAGFEAGEPTRARIARVE